MDLFTLAWLIFASGLVGAAFGLIAVAHSGRDLAAAIDRHAAALHARQER